MGLLMDGMNVVGDLLSPRCSCPGALWKRAWNSLERKHTQVMKSARVMKKAVVHLIPHIEEEKLCA